MFEVFNHIKSFIMKKIIDFISIYEVIDECS